MDLQFTNDPAAEEALAATSALATAVADSLPADLPPAAVQEIIEETIAPTTQQ